MRNSAVIKLALLLSAMAIGAYFVQAAHKEEFPGNYPKFAQPVEAKFAFKGERGRITVPQELNGQRVIAFAYDGEGRMYGILKPVENGEITIRRGDNADLEVRFEEKTRIAGFDLLKRMDRYVKKVDMFAALQDAQASGRKLGVQRCLFPLCTRCVEGCRSMVSGGDLPLQMQPDPDGAIRPVYSRGKCPRCGKCFKWCPVQVITDSQSLSAR